MASTPTSKSQVQAYRFVLRRMESALVRKDAVMLHDPMRTHKRATVVGVIIGVIILLGFLIVSIFKPSAALPTDQASIVIAQPSGQVYVLDQNPRQLIPVFNLASARLLLLAESQSSGSAGGGSGGSAGSANGPAPATVVDDSELAGVPVGRLTGIPDGPQALPGAVGAAQDWSVCDQIPLNNSAPDQGVNNPASSTVIVGQPAGGTQLTPGQALYVQSDDGTKYLIYHTSPTANEPNDTAMVAPIDTGDPYVVNALQLQSATPRHISAALLNTIPKGPEIQDPFKDVSGAGSGTGAAGLTIGAVFGVQATGSSPETYWAVLRDGVQQVSQTVALILLGHYDNNQASVPLAPEGRFASLNQVKELPKVGQYPNEQPTILNANQHPVVCLNWNADYTKETPQVDTQLTVGTQLNLPPGVTKPLPIGQVGPNGLKVDSFAMNPASLSLGVTVRSATNFSQFQTGPIMLITPRGVTYSIDNVTTALALGVANGSPGPGSNGAFGLWPGPAEIIGLLPTGSQELNPTNVQRTYDSVPVPETAGQYTAVAPSAAGGP